MTTETLSDKIFIGIDENDLLLPVKDVREFIKKLKDRINGKRKLNKWVKSYFNEIIDELAGEKLTVDENRCPYCNWINGEHMKECIKLTEKLK